MSSQVSRASPRAGAQFFARIQAVGRALKRFGPKAQPVVVALARRHPRLADLSVSFPALLVALAWPNGRALAPAVIDGVIAGAPLASLAAAARVPLWLRHLAPEMLPAPLPEMPDGAFVRHRIVNHLPVQAKFAPRWFAVVAFAHLWADEAFVLWCAREFAHVAKAGSRHDRRRVNRGRRPGRLALLCLWAWYSTRPEEHAASLIRRPWRPEMPLQAAHRHADDWATAVELDLNLGGRPIPDCWLSLRHWAGYEFVPLAGAADIAAEADAMCNCVRTYSDGLIHDRIRLFGLRKDGARLATVCVGWENGDPYPVITQLALAGNKDAPDALWWAARQWLNAHDLSGLAKRDFDWSNVAIDRGAWTRMWKPYWMAKGRAPLWLPLAPSRHALRDL